MRKFALALLTSLASAALAGPYDPAPTPMLAPAESVKHFRVPAGFEVRLFAAEPDVVNPVAMTWDDRGRLWVVELIDYPYTTKEGGKNKDRVKVLEDTDGDGKADKVTVFAEGLNLATGIAVGNGGVYVGAAPNLWFMRDTNGDDVADEKKVILTGFGLEDRHELLNGFNWGPDGWLYFTHGVFTNSSVTDPARPERPPVKFNAGVMRLNPADNHLEVFSDGISNQWGLDWDRYGNAFVSACVVEHLWHVVPGGIYVRQGGLPGWPYAYDLLKHINDHKHYRAAYAGAQVYQGGAYPAEYDGTIFMGNIHGNCINHDKLVPNGSSFTSQDLHKGKDHQDDAFLNSTDGWFRPVSTQTGPDGNLWVMDWYDKYPCYQNSRAPDLDRSTGRIWRVVYTGDQQGKAVPSRQAVDMDLQKLTDAQLVETLANKNVWMRRHAQRVLSERKANVKEALAGVLKSNRSIEARMAALWTTYTTGQLDAAGMKPLAKDPEPAVRAWVARFIGENSDPGDELLGGLAFLAQDKSPVVRAAVAQALKRLVAHDPSLPVMTLLTQAGTAADPMLPELIWYAAESLVVKDPKSFLGFYASSAEALEASGPLVPRSIARRLYASGDAKLMQPLMEFVTKQKDKAITAVFLDGVIAGHKKFMPAPAGAEEVLAALSTTTNQEVAARVKRLSTLWGAKAAVEMAIKTIADPKANEGERVEAVQAVRGQKSGEVRDALVSALAANKRLRALKAETLRALADVGDDATAGQILAQWNEYLPETRNVACEVLAQKPAWARQLLEAVQAKKVTAAEVPLPALRTLANHKDLQKLMATTLGAYRPTPGDKQKVIEAKKAVVMSGTPDKERGKELFLKNCGVCHSLAGEGSVVPVGPDLTGVGRGTLDLLLNNVIDPDQIIGAGYENTIVDTEEGDTKTGRLVEETDQYVKLLAAGPREDVIPKKAIKERRVSNKSVMPEGFEQILKDDEFRDLIRYVLEAPATKP